MKKIFGALFILALIQTPVQGYQIRLNNRADVNVKFSITLVSDGMGGCTAGYEWVKAGENGLIETDCLHKAIKAEFLDPASSDNIREQRTFIRNGKTVEVIHRPKSARGLHTNITVSGTFPNYTIKHN